MFIIGLFDADKCVKGDIYLVSEGHNAYYAEFKGGDDIVHGFRIYDEVKLFHAIGTLYKTAPFSNGDILSAARYQMLIKELSQ